MTTKTNPARFLSILLSAFLIIIITACGGGSGDSMLSPSDLTAKEAKGIYEKNKILLQEYVDGQTLNPDLSVVYGITCAPYDRYRGDGTNQTPIVVSVSYKGKEIQNIKSVPMGCYSGITMKHGFTRNGVCIITMSMHINQETMLFVDGKYLFGRNSGMYFEVNGLSEYDGTWLLVNTGSPDESPYFLETMSALNMNTGEFIVLGNP